MNLEEMKNFPGMRVRWCLSKSHEEKDVCDSYAAGGPAGDGVYDPNECPQFPAHDGCKCYLSPEPIDPGEMVDLVRAWQKDPGSQPEIEKWYEKNRDKF